MSRVWLNSTEKSKFLFDSRFDSNNLTSDVLRYNEGIISDAFIKIGLNIGDLFHKILVLLGKSIILLGCEVLSIILFTLMF
jgi:hypothetical protein